ncbi:MAG: hypothetical protein ACI97A_000291 [Planctomycetota bacterium]|jgi:hypothetical protein
MQNIGLTKRRFIILMLFLIPAGWAIFVQVLVRRSPPGAAITNVSGDIIWAMEQIRDVDPHSPTYQLRYNLKVGETWSCVIKATPSSSGEDLFQILDEDRSSSVKVPQVLSGTYDLTVVKQEDQRWLLKISATKGGSLSDPYYCWLDAFGNMGPFTNEATVTDARDVLYRKTGIYLAGPFKPELRARDWCSKQPGSSLGMPAAVTVERLKLTSTAEVMQPSGGLKFMGPVNYLNGVGAFKILSYRRMQFERIPWEGYVELVIRADYTYPEASIHLLSGVGRFRDLIDLQKERKVGAAKEHTLYIKQTMTHTGE